MTIDEKIQYAYLRSQGAALFGKDKEEALRWLKAMKELEKEKMEVHNDKSKS